VRITAQLIDAGNGGHLWAERYDRDWTDIFEVQDDVTRRIVDALKITLSPAEKARLAESGTSNMEAYDAALRGRELLLGKTRNRETFGQAKAFFLKAIELDPNYAQAYAGMGFLHMFDYQNRWSDDPDGSLGHAKRYAQLAIEKDPKQALPHVVAAVAAGFDRDLERAKAEVDIALSLNPNLALANNVFGTMRIYSGRPLEAIPAIERAMRLDPAGNRQFLHFLGMANLLAGKYETAAALLKERVVLVPETDFSRAILASALGHLGEVEQARRVWAELQQINPKYTFKEHFSRQPFKNPEDVARIAEGLTKAGLPA
jgi:adenylate cyclase